MKKEKEKDEKNTEVESFVNEYLTTKNVLLGLGVASLAGVATYSGIQAMKNGKVLDKIKEINFDKIKNSIASTMNDLGLGGRKASEKSGSASKGKGQRPAAKSKGTKKAAAKSKAQKRYITG